MKKKNTKIHNNWFSHLICDIVGAGGIFLPFLGIMLSKKFDSFNELWKTAYITHEKVHAKQFSDDGLKFIFGYIFDKKKRLDYEIEAYSKEAVYLISTGYLLEEVCKDFAQALSSKLYHKMITYDEAYVLLKNTINSKLQNET